MPNFLLTFTAGVAALQSVSAAASLRSNGNEGAGRNLQQTLYCNSIGCPDSFIPIPNAWEVPCSGECEVSQCCQSFCSFFACPDSFTPVSDAAEIQCDSDCDQDLCCEAFCSYFPCPNGYIPIPDANTELCVGDCSAEQCCVSGNTAGTGGVVPGVPGEDVLLCNSIGCPDSFTPIPEAWLTVCDSDPCSEEQCCEAFCSYYACPDNYIPVEDAAEIQCDAGCSTELCCVNNVP